MAQYQPVHSIFWRDKTVRLKMSHLEKLFMLYLITNQNTGLAAVYPLVLEDAANDTGLTIIEVKTIIDRLQKDLQLIRYDNETEEIAIKHWFRYHPPINSPKTLKALRSEERMIKNQELVKYVYAQNRAEIPYPESGYPISNPDTVSSSHQSTSQGQLSKTERKYPISNPDTLPVKIKENKININNSGDYSTMHSENESITENAETSDRKTPTPAFGAPLYSGTRFGSVSETLKNTKRRPAKEPKNQQSAELIPDWVDTKIVEPTEKLSSNRK